MNRGSPAGLTASSNRSSSPNSASHRRRPGPSPSRRSSSPSWQSKSSRRDTDRRSSKTTNGDANGDAASDSINGHNDSEAETVHLSDEGHEKSKAIRRIVKEEPRDFLSRSSPSLATRSEPARSAPGSRASSVAVDISDKPERKTNGLKSRENGIKNGSMKPSAHGRPASIRDRDTDSPRAQSAEAAGSSGPRSDSRDRKVDLAEPRKRKLSDAHRPSRLEPARQKPRLDGPAKERVPSPSYGLSPPASATGTRSHRRSASTQSNVVKPPASAPPRPRRDTNSRGSEEGRAWNSDSGSDPSSPRPRSVTVLAAPRSKTLGKALTSPAPVGMPHGKKTDKFGLTALARAAEKGQYDAVVSAYNMSPDELDLADNAGYAPLQKAALAGKADIVEFLLSKGCKRDCQAKNGDTPLIDSIENGHLDVVRLLLKHGVNPHHQNEKGQRAIDLINDEEDEADEMKLILQKAMKEYEVDESEDENAAEKLMELDAKGERKDLLHKENTTKSLRDYAQRGDLQAVDYFLSMRVKPDIECCIVAARGGHEMILNMLLADTPVKDPDPATYGETPILAAIGRGHLKVLKLLLDQSEFNPCRKNREGKYYWQISEESQGPKWQAERDLLKERFDLYRSSHGKTAKKKRPAETASHRRTNSTSKLEQSSTNDRSPKHAAKTKIKSERTERQEKADKTDRSRLEDDHPKARRLVNAKDIPRKEVKQRRRRVVDDESSRSDSESDDVRAPSKPTQRRRKSSTASKTAAPARDADRQSSPKVKRDHSEKDRHEKRRRMSNSSPHAERRKKSEAHALERRLSKPQDKDQDDVEMEDVSAPAAAPAEPVKEGTPEAEREARRAAKKAEEERLQREKEEAEKKRLEEERLRQEVERLRKEEEVRKRRERLDSVPEALRYAMEFGPDRPLRFTPGANQYEDILGIEYNFLPILQWSSEDIGRKGGEDKPSEKWMMSFQAVGLLGLPELYLEEFPQWERQAVTSAQRDQFLKNYCIDKITYYHYRDDNGPRPMDLDTSPQLQQHQQTNGTTVPSNQPDEPAAAVPATTSIEPKSPNPQSPLQTYYEGFTAAKEMIRNLNPLDFIRVEDFLTAVPQYPHLNGLEMRRAPGPVLKPVVMPDWPFANLINGMNIQSPAAEEVLSSGQEETAKDLDGAATLSKVKSGVPASEQDHSDNTAPIAPINDGEVAPSIEGKKEGEANATVSTTAATADQIMAEAT